MRLPGDEDWEPTAGPSAVDESELDRLGEAIDNSGIERVLQGNLNDPLLSSDEEANNDIDWSAVFRSKNRTKFFLQNQTYCPGLRPPTTYPKLSILTTAQHYMGLKVICVQHPHVLPQQPIQLPLDTDIENMEILNGLYKNEQEQFREWAKNRWRNQYYKRALSPKPIIEVIYEAEFNMRAQRLRDYPKNFNKVRLIPLLGDSVKSIEVVVENSLIDLRVFDLPMVALPSLTEHTTILLPCSVPEPCVRHPYKIKLPKQHTITTQPIREIHRELATFAARNNSKYIASENALRCLTAFNRYWTIPVTVCSTYTADGKRMNVVVLDSEFFIRKEPVMVRSYRAYRHLLSHAIIPTSEMRKIYKKRNKEFEIRRQFEIQRLNEINEKELEHSHNNNKPLGQFSMNENVESSKHQHEPNKREDGEKIVSRAILEPDRIIWTPSDPLGMMKFKDANPKDNDELLEEIRYEDDDDEVPNNPNEPERNADIFELLEKIKVTDDDSNNCFPSEDTTKQDKYKNIDLTLIDDINSKDYNCTCTDAPNDVAPQRSFKKLSIWNQNTEEGHDLIVHYSHRARHNEKELVLEPIPEYQLELGGSELTPDRKRSLVLALLLRDAGAALIVRVDGSNGDFVTYNAVPAARYICNNMETRHQVVNAIYNVLGELEGLLPGHYVLQHDPEHGTNASLLVACPEGDNLATASTAGDNLKLEFDNSQLFVPDDSITAAEPPIIGTALLPFHKVRKILPCAFSPYKFEIGKELAKAPTKKKAPPQSHKKSKKGKKKNKKK